MSGHRQIISSDPWYVSWTRRKSLRGGEAGAVERMSMPTHNGTHVDVPWHFASTINHDESALTTLYFRDLADDQVVSAVEVPERVETLGRELNPFDRAVEHEGGAAHALVAGTRLDRGYPFGGRFHHSTADINRRRGDWSPTFPGINRLRNFP